MEFWNNDSDEWSDDPGNTFMVFSSETKPQRGGLHMLLTDYELKTRAKKKEEDSDFPARIIRKEDKKLKDVVKEHVLPFLPAKSLSRFKAVSKEWGRWISSPLLAYQQSFSCKTFSGYFYQDTKVGFDPMFLSVDRSTSGVPSPSFEFLPEKVTILSSCSGLLLCQGWEKYYVCNPATQDWKMLPLAQYYHGAEPAVVLAFDPSPRNIEGYYHVVCAFPMLGQPIIGFEIYSSESNVWTCSSTYCAELEDVSLCSGGLYFKGVAYYETTSNEVLAFDVKDEIPAVMSLPVHAGGCGSLMQMEGELCYVTANNECGNVFLIDVYGGADMRLKRSMSINLGVERSFTQSCEVLPSVNSDAVAIHVGRFIYLYNPVEQKCEYVILERAVSGKRFLPYVNSLVMLHELKES